MKEMLLEDYSLEKGTVRGLARYVLDLGSDYSIKSQTVYTIENELSSEDKIEIINYHTDGLAGYLLNLIDKYDREKDNEEIFVPTIWGINKNSYKKWMKANDPRKVLSLFGPYPKYHLFGQSYGLTRVCPHTDYGYKLLYTDTFIVNQWFHDLLRDLEKKETEYFNTHDHIQVKINKVKKLADGFSLYGVTNDKLNDLVWNSKRDGFTEEELDFYIGVFEEVVSFMEEKRKVLSDYGKKHDKEEVR